MKKEKQKSVLISPRVIAAVLFLSVCVLLLCPAVAVFAASDYEPGAYKYSFHVQGQPHYVEDELVYDYDHIVSINGDDVDFFSYYSYYWDNGHKRADYFVLYAVSDSPFTWVDYYNGNYYSKSSQSKVVDGKTVYYGNILGRDGNIENENNFGTYVGSPNLKYVEHEFGVDGFTYVQDLISERLKEFVENGGIDWEFDPDLDAFYDDSLPYLSELSYEVLSSSDCHGDPFYNPCFRLSWLIPEGSIRDDVLEIKMFCKYNYATPWSTKREYDSGFYYFNDIYGTIPVSRGSFEFCVSDFAEYLDLGASSFTLLPQRIFIRILRDTPGGRSYGDWVIYDVDRDVLNNPSVGKGEVVAGDADIDDFGNYDDEKVKDTITPPEKGSGSFDFDFSNVGSVLKMFKGIIEDLISALGMFPVLFSTVFGFLPQPIANSFLLVFIIALVIGILKIFT